MEETPRPDRSGYRVRKTTLREQGAEDDLDGTTPEQRVEMMWQLALDAWAFTGTLNAEPRLQRHIVRVYRREG